MGLGDGVRPFLERRTREVETRVRRLADQTRVDLQVEAPWTDQSGDARDSLDATVETNRRGRGATLTLTLGYHGSPGVDYGVFLEKKQAGRFAIVDPTAERIRPAFRRAVVGGMTRGA
ncbi:MAG: hypothetical protein ACRDI2_23250 [Chloroflexota bacterium]